MVECWENINSSIFIFKIKMSENSSNPTPAVQVAGVEAVVPALGLPIPLGSTAATTEARMEHLRASALLQTMLQSVRSVQAEPGKLLVSFELPQEAPVAAATGPEEDVTLPLQSRHQSWQRWESQRAVEELKKYLDKQELSSTSDEPMIIEGLDPVGPSTVETDVSALPLKKRKRGRKAKGLRQWTLEDHYAWKPEASEDEDAPLAVSRKVTQESGSVTQEWESEEEVWDAAERDVPCRSHALAP